MGKVRERSRSGGDNFIFATDTGITAALGLLNSSTMLPTRNRTRLLWFAESADYFLPFRFVTEELDRIDIRKFSVIESPPVSDGTRMQKALNLIEAIVREEAPGRAYLCGDGAVIYAVQERLIGAGMTPENIRIECFFNNPQRKAA